MSRTVVVGASSGLGRCIGVGLAQRGAQVALLARRRARIEVAAEEAGPGAVAIECDVTDEASCRSAFDGAAEALGGIDNLIYETYAWQAHKHYRNTTVVDHSKPNTSVALAILHRLSWPDVIEL